MLEGRALRRLAKAAVPLATATLVLVLAVALGWPARTARPRFQDLAYDLANQLSPRRDEGAPVRIVDIDEASLERLGQWPWPRTVLAALVERLREAGAAAIAFDIVFAEPDRTSPAQVVRQWNDAPELRRLVADLPDHDRLFAQAVGGGGVVTGFIAGEAGERMRQPAAKTGIAFAGPSAALALPRFASA